MLQTYSIKVTGKVQGVFYRQSARQLALSLGLVGYARNEPDGSVRIEVEGDSAALDRFVTWCRVGPPGAQVDRVDVAEGAAQGYAGFRTM